MGPIVLLIAAFIFIVDAAFLFGKAGPRGTGVCNLAIGIVMAIMGLDIGFGANGEAFPMILSSLSATFSLFYLILGWCLLGGYDLKSLGWYSLGAGLWVILAAVYFAAVDPIFSGFAVAWSALFLSAFANLALGSNVGGVMTRWLLAICAPITLMIPAYLLITGQWPPF